MAGIVRILGLIDLAAALFILFWVGAPFWLKFVFILVLLIKGVPSLFADLIGKIYGIVDIITAIVLAFAIHLPGVATVLLAIVLIFKGLFSLP